MPEDAALKADADDIAAIEEAWQQLERIIETRGIGAHDDFLFHLAVARASRNPFFITVMSFIEEQIVFSMNLSRNLSNANLSLNQIRPDVLSSLQAQGITTQLQQYRPFPQFTDVQIQFPSNALPDYCALLL